MAQLDTSIYQTQPRSVDDYAAQADAADQRKLTGAATRMQLLLQGKQVRAAQQAEDDQNRLLTLMRGLPPTATDEDRIRALRGGAFFNQADALDKSVLERRKTDADIAYKGAETVDKGAETRAKTATLFRQQLDTVNNPQAAAQWLRAQFVDPALGPHMRTMGTYEDAVQHIPQDPAGFEQWRQRAGMGMEKFVADQTARRGQDLTAQTSRSNNAATVAATIRGQDLVNQRALDTHAASVTKPFEVTGPDGIPMLVQQDRSGKIIPVAGFQPKGMGATKLTEDQGKATGWLSQATNAYDNMTAALKSTPSASKPGFNDAIAAVPSFGIGEAIGNKMRGPDRQKYVQSMSSLSEALLRAATGAGVNKEEAAQKVRELTPQFGDGDDVIQQKMDAIPVYLESLKVRAGPGAKQLPDIMARANAQKSQPGKGRSQSGLVTPVPANGRPPLESFGG